MRKASLITVSTLGFALLCGGLAWLVPNPTGTDTFHFHAFLSAALTMALIYIGSSILFAAGLGGFTPKLKRAYRRLCIGVVLFGLAQMQLPLTVLENNQASWHKIDIMPVVYLISIFMMYLGIRAFAKLFKITGLSITWWAPLVMFIATAIPIAFVPHPPAVQGELQFDGANIFICYIAAFVFFGVWQLLQVKRVAGAAYTNALAWLIVGYMVIYSSGLTVVVVQLFTGGAGPWYIDIFTVLVPFTIGSLCFLRAAYSFYAIGNVATVVEASQTSSFFGRVPATTQRSAHVASSIDIILYTVGLVANKKEIDPLLDDMRSITSQLANGRRPSKQQDQQLQQVYLRIEKYLVENEQVRSFTREQIHHAVESNLKLGTGEDNFWQSL